MVADRLARDLDKKAHEGLDEATLRKAVNTICVSTKPYSVGSRWILKNLNIFARLNFSLREFVLSYKETEHAANAFMCDARILMHLHSEERLPFIEYAYQHFGLPETDNPISLVHAMLDAGISPNEIVDMFSRCMETSLPRPNKAFPENDFLRILASRNGESHLGNWLMSPRDFTKKAGKEKIKEVLVKAIELNPNLLLQYPILMKRFTDKKEYTKLITSKIQRIKTLRFVSHRTIQELDLKILLKLVLNLQNKGWKTNFEIYTQACTRILLEIPEEFLEKCWNNLKSRYAGKYARKSLQYSAELLKTAGNQNRANWIRRGLGVRTDNYRVKPNKGSKHLIAQC